MLGWFSLGDTQEHHQQHVLSEEVAGPEPLPQAAEMVRDKLKKAEIIPTVIDDFLPSLGLHATWPSHHKRAELGNTLPPSQLGDEPSIALHDMRASSQNPTTTTSSSKKVTYAITLTDPDAPSRNAPAWGEFCHWVAAGVLEPALCDPREPGPCAPVLSHLREIVRYKAPAPPKGTGLHRYVLLAFVPSNGTTERLRLSRPGGRKRWGYGGGGGDEGDGDGDGDGDGGGGGDAGKGGTRGVRQWARENGLAPVGANFIYAKHEE
ncbi:phosphatidylethanolamine-binding protein [Chaetomium fimeti]|uniref:Phosphatidylethanolamine-binding protein n=1 Tax=Chaetomium fimeti TaxID=1854472 RepID=A0AAE0LU11_9PEZI|nr:phosphatidylethanolamine-binding protein [Chaetomium fimeti]